MNKIYDNDFKSEMREKARLSTGLQQYEWSVIPETCKTEVYEDYLLNELVKARFILK